ncbi:uncharacterized protein PgNI_09064 [Pyricularia grisea]|uniref:HNH nuclease domain-containing protein n=1 Tax=Pyricularia grisea TaxID=148305 RepID=A0A6P8AT18_PYRGI|nr:uncharacterized protein PgNI_09064 [Pyricularia grisea]TLD05271.1 hypothetical protein PgNI_09064 [Pyricularia grisea]
MASAAFPVLAPLEPPQTTIESPFRVHFRHPAYPDNAPPLLALFAINGVLDYDLALVCCCILAAVNWDKGYLAVRQQGSLFEKVQRPSDGLLRGREYFFCLEDVAVSGKHPLATSFCPFPWSSVAPFANIASYVQEKYPIVHSFHNWRFPHDNLPPQWARLDVPEYRPPQLLKGPSVIVVRDGSCRISGFTNAVELAHLIPVKEKKWFTSNGISSMHQIMSDDRNILLLRSDLHHLFKTRRIALVPKLVDMDTSLPPQLLGHILKPRASTQLIPLYHNRFLQHVQGLSKEFLFARFAWSLFTDERIPFVAWSGMFNIFVWNRITNLVEQRVCTSADVSSFSQVFAFSTRSQNRSVSPKKRQMVDDLGWGYSDCTSSDGEDTWGNDGYIDDSPFEQDAPRGRPLFRTSVRRSMPKKRRFHEDCATQLMLPLPICRDMIKKEFKMKQDM